MINLAKDLPKRTPRERVWDAIRANAGEFTIQQVADIANMKLDSARDYVTGLRRAGFVQEVRREKKRFQGVYTIYLKLVNDVGNTAPSVDRKGNLLNPREGNTAMWNVLRICGAVNAQSLAALASTEEHSVSAETAASYLQTLHQAGYLNLVRPSHHAVRVAVYALRPDKNTGSKPPQIQRAKQVYDPNLGAVVYAERPELAEELRDGVHPELEGYGHD